MSAQTPSQVDEAIAEFRAFQARAAQPDRAPEPVIRVNGVAISADAVQREAQNHPADDPKDALEAAARALVVRELLLQEARGRNLTAVPERDEATSAKKASDPNAFLADMRRIFGGS